MIDKASGAQMRDEAMGMALRKEIGTMQLRIRRDLFLLHLQKLRLNCRLFFFRAKRKLFLYGKLFYHKVMVGLMNCFLALNEFYEKFSRHKSPE